MTHSSRPLACDRARSHVSQRLDGELSELERASLDAHLAGCRSCTAYAASITSLTTHLRSAPLEQPLRRIVMPRLHARLRGAQLGAAAAALVIAAGVGSALGVLRSNGLSVTGVGASVRPAFLDSGYAEVRAIRKSQEGISPALRRTAI
jgi:predicted anti-sigma-YlaC factor YlaD